MLNIASSFISLITLLSGSSEALSLRSDVAAFKPAEFKDMVFKDMNLTSYTDDKCTTIDSSKKTKNFKLNECKRQTIAYCSTGNATIVYYNDDACTQYNSTSTFVPGVCTPTGPKTQRLGKVAMCN